MYAQVTTARLPSETLAKLIFLAKTKGKTKSGIIKESLDQYYEREAGMVDSYALGKQYFGKYNLGDGDLSVTYKQRIKEKIRARQNSY